MTSFADFFSAQSGSATHNARAFVWEQMLHQAFQLLEEAQRRVCSAAAQRELRKLDGWWRTKKLRLNGKSYLVPTEEAVSEALWREMEKIKEEIILRITPSDALMASVDTLQVCIEQPRRTRIGIGKRSKPTDIRFYRAGSEILDLRIEAKVLLRQSDIKKSYLGNTGLKRFSDSKEPYTDQEVGGMLAYVVTDSRSAWLAQIDQALQGAAPPIQTFRHRIRTTSEDTLFSPVPYPGISTPRNEVLVFHVVLEFSCEPDARK